MILTDLIDRGYLRKMLMYEPSYTMPQDAFTKVMQALEDIPRADVDIVKDGKWTFDPNHRTGGTTSCNQCRTVFGGDLRKTRFCPECGSRNVPKIVVL